MKARDVMTTHPSVVTPDDLISKAARIFRDRNIGILPVIDNLRNRSLLGILTDRDIVVRCIAAGHGSACHVRDHMTTGALTCADPDADTTEVAAKMEGFQLRRFPVLDHGGHLVGIVALADLRKRTSGGAPGPGREPEPLEHGAMALAH